MIQLLTAQTADTAGSQEDFFYIHPKDGKVGTIIAEGTFDGATVSIEIKRADYGDWVSVPGSSFTSEGSAVLNGGGFQIRGAVSGAGASTNISLSVVS